MLADVGVTDVGTTAGHVHSGLGSTEGGRLERTSAQGFGPATSDGQRFRILRPYARGGLGAVYLALDTELIAKWR